MTYPQIRPYFGGGSGIAPALSIDGQFFRSHGERWTSIATSDFSLLKRYLENEDIRPILDERCAIGFNELRIWSLNNGVVADAGFPEGIHPNQYHDFYERSRKCWELIGTYGLAIEDTAFTATDPLMTNVDDQVRHWERTQEAARGLAHVRLELVNEYDWGQGQNAPDKSLWSMRPSGILASSGSAVAGAQTATPVWDYGSYHSNGLSEWQRKCAHNAMEDVADKFKIPGTANENMRCPDDDDNPQRFHDAAAGAALLSAGACFHSQAGKFSRPFDAVERACAQAWCDGARSVPLEFQAGVYARHDELNSDTVLRAYTRTLPDGRSHLVLIHY